MAADSPTTAERARDVLERQLCRTFYGSAWEHTSEFRRGICRGMALDGIAALDAAGLGVVPGAADAEMVRAALDRPAGGDQPTLYHGIWAAMFGAATKGAPTP